MEVNYNLNSEEILEGLSDILEEQRLITTKLHAIRWEIDRLRLSLETTKKIGWEIKALILGKKIKDENVIDTNLNMKECNFERYKKGKK